MAKTKAIEMQGPFYVHIEDGAAAVREDAYENVILHIDRYGAIVGIEVNTDAIIDGIVDRIVEDDSEIPQID